MNKLKKGFLFLRANLTQKKYDRLVDDHDTLENMDKEYLKVDLVQRGNWLSRGLAWTFIILFLFLFEFGSFFIGVLVGLGICLKTAKCVM